MKIIYTLIIFIILLPACTKKGSSLIDSQANDNQHNTVKIPEPSIQDKAATRFKLTELVAVQEKFLKLNDNITFTGLGNKKLKEESSVKDISLHIKTHCILNQKDVVIHNFNKSLQESISLIELLPKEVFLSQTSTPSCGFSFKAQNKEGSAHHFELPQLPIINHTANHLIELFNSSGEVTAPFPYVFINKISDYWLNTGTQEQIDTVNLICDDFSLSLPIRPQQFIPFSAFPLNELNTEIKQKITKNNPHQECRIFGYKKNILTGVSSIFHLSYPQPPLHVSIIDDLFEHRKRQQSFYFEILDADGREIENRPDIPIYSYLIRNPHPYPVYILIENYKNTEEELMLNFYGLYYKAGKSFYVWHDDVFHLSGIQIVEGKNIQIHAIGEDHLIKLTPHSEIEFSVLLKERFTLCSSVHEKSHWLGAVVKFTDLKIYQLVSDQVNPAFMSQNILHQLNTHAGKSFSILTDHLTEKTMGTRSFWFKKGICSGKMIAQTIDPVIELYRKTSKSNQLKPRWIDFTSVVETDYFRTNQSIGAAINNK